MIKSVIELNVVDDTGEVLYVVTMSDSLLALDVWKGSDVVVPQVEGEALADGHLVNAG